MVDTVNYYSKEDNNKYNYIPRYQLDIKEAASILTKNHFVTKNAMISYTGTSNTFKLRLDDHRCYKKFGCDCGSFIKWAICIHVVAYSNLHGLNFMVPNINRKQ